MDHDPQWRYGPFSFSLSITHWLPAVSRFLFSTYGQTHVSLGLKLVTASGKTCVRFCCVLCSTPDQTSPWSALSLWMDVLAYSSYRQKNCKTKLQRNDSRRPGSNRKGTRHIKTIQHQDGLKKRANCQDWRSTLKGCLMGLASIPDRSLTEFCLSLFHTMTSSSHLCFPGDLHWDYYMNLSIQIPCQLFLKKHTVKNSPKTPLSTANPHYSSD